MTNSVAQNFTANMLLAVGAVPSMTVAPEEIAEFVKRSDALLVNLGTLDPARREAAETAARVAVEAAAGLGARPGICGSVNISQRFCRKAYGQGSESHAAQQRRNLKPSQA